MTGQVIGLGIDLCEIARIGRAMRGERFLLRVFTEGERAHIAERGAAGAASAAGLFAAKEAVAKALGTGFDRFFLDSVEIYWDGRGMPLCRLTGAARERLGELGGTRVMLSVTHERGMAAAVAVALT